MAITQPRMIQIPKFWCLKSCTNIWLHFGNIHSIQKINRIELEGKKGSKFAKIGKFFTLQKIKIEFSQKFPKVWFHGFFLSLPTVLGLIDSTEKSHDTRQSSWKSQSPAVIWEYPQAPAATTWPGGDSTSAPTLRTPLVTSVPHSPSSATCATSPTCLQTSSFYCELWS